MSLGKAKMAIFGVVEKNTINKILCVAPLLSSVLLSGCDWAKASDVITQNQAPTNQVVINAQFWGEASQSSTIIGRTTPNSEIDAGGIITKADNDGYFVFGFDRDAPETMTITITAPDKHSTSRIFKIQKREYKITTVNGLPAATINPPPEAMAKIQTDSALKQQAFDSKDQEVKGYLEVFKWPLANIVVTSPWGAQRTLNGNMQRPHYGLDLAAPTGTPILAPASGRVVLAQAGMHYEGGMVAIDHGQGLITNYLHMSKITAQAGQIVKAGDKIGEVGKEGRATGPHLCWRMRWRGRQLDPSLMTKAKEDLPTNIEALALK
jgi:murein DD-endopeptidase MepM/ murein hydrolase activator NlpD